MAPSIRSSDGPGTQRSWDAEDIFHAAIVSAISRTIPFVDLRYAAGAIQRLTHEDGIVNYLRYTVETGWTASVDTPSLATETAIVVNVKAIRHRVCSEMEGEHT